MFFSLFLFCFNVSYNTVSPFLPCIIPYIFTELWIMLTTLPVHTQSKRAHFQKARHVFQRRTVNSISKTFNYLHASLNSIKNSKKFRTEHRQQTFTGGNNKTYLELDLLGTHIGLSNVYDVKLILITFC